MNEIVFALPGNEELANRLSHQFGYIQGSAHFRQFPDGEWYVRLLTNVKGKQVVVACALDHPDTSILPLYFLASYARDHGAARVIIIAPYLPYMRQDQEFQKGEIV